ncbi:hypothetical protein [Azotobacter chroococcum]|uniref:hypothetical protein n=1 Tax=Azotobacter chroococcum TaxID=353 RepID=UPI0012FDBA23|nr:hypothetical protein [Azotobacter chroococcum]
MKSVFRYSKKKYNDSLLKLGGIRIGTLHDFRKAEHKQGISDPNEGKRIIRHHIPYVNSDDEDSIHLKAIQMFGVIKVANGLNCTFENVNMAMDFNLPDCFVYCVSSCLSRNVMGQFEGADSCVEVVDVMRFFNRLTDTLHRNVPIRDFVLSEVKYQSRDEVWNNKDLGVHPAFIKESEFSSQFEVRMIWIPKFKDAISPIILSDVGLVRFLKVVSV